MLLFGFMFRFGVGVAVKVQFKVSKEIGTCVGKWACFGGTASSVGGALVLFGLGGCAGFGLFEIEI